MLLCLSCFDFVWYNSVRLFNCTYLNEPMVLHRFEIHVFWFMVGLTCPIFFSTVLVSLHLVVFFFCGFAGADIWNYPSQRWPFDMTTCCSSAVTYHPYMNDPPLVFLDDVGAAMDFLKFFLCILNTLAAGIFTTIPWSLGSEIRSLGCHDFQRRTVSRPPEPWCHFAFSIVTW